MCIPPPLAHAMVLLMIQTTHKYEYTHSGKWFILGCGLHRMRSSKLIERDLYSLLVR